MNIDRVSALLAKAEEVPTFFLNYTRLRAKSVNLPIFVFEGVDDPKYYTSRISYKFSQEWRPLSVNGKRNVLDLRDRLKGHPIYFGDNVSFYVDKDFDEIACAEDLYVTPCYSVENFYVARETIRQLLFSAGGFSTNEESDSLAVDWIVNKYCEIRDAYISHKDVKRMNLVFLYVRKKLQKNNISLDSLFAIEHKIEDTYNFSISKKQKFPEIFSGINLNDFTSFIRTDKTARMIRKGQAYFYRGKQELKLLQTFIFAIRNHEKPLNRAIHTQCGKQLKFKNANFGSDPLQDMSSVADTPGCLVKFLDTLSVKLKGTL